MFDKTQGFTLKKQGFVAFLLLGLFYTPAVSAGMELWLGFGRPVAMSLGLFVAEIPIVGSIAALIGAMQAWDWPFLRSFFVFVLPPLALLSLIKISGKRGPQRTRRLAEVRGALSAQASDVSDKASGPYDVYANKALASIINVNFFDFIKNYNKGIHNGGADIKLSDYQVALLERQMLYFSLFAFKTIIRLTVPDEQRHTLFFEAAYRYFKNRYPYALASIDSYVDQYSHEGQELIKALCSNGGADVLKSLPPMDRAYSAFICSYERSYQRKEDDILKLLPLIFWKIISKAHPANFPADDDSAASLIVLMDVFFQTVKNVMHVMLKDVH